MVLRDDLHGWAGWEGRLRREGIYVYTQVTHSVTQQKLTHIINQLYPNKQNNTEISLKKKKRTSSGLS